MPFDAHKNLAISAVATAPSPASSGASLDVTAGHGARFPAVPFNATVWPDGSLPDPANAEVVRVTARSTDTLTITRAQESTAARTIVVGDRIAAGMTAKTITDLEDELGVDPSGSFTTVKDRFDALRRTPVTALSSTVHTVPGVVASSQATVVLSANIDYYFPIHVEDYLTFDQLAVEVTTAASAGATGRLAIYTAGTNWQPTDTLIEDFGSFLIDATGTKTTAPSGGTRTIAGGRYLIGLNISVGATFRSLRGGVASQPLLTGAQFFGRLLNGARAHAVFPSTPNPWTSAGSSAVPCEHVTLMRVTA